MSVKVRSGFVSNSSSSSFIVEVNDINFNCDLLSKDRFSELVNIAHSLGWEVEVYRGYLLASTDMDNEDLISYLLGTHLETSRNVISFGTHSNFSHSFEDMRKFVDEYLL